MKVSDLTLNYTIGIDNHTSYSISNNLEHFTFPITPSNSMLLGVNGKSKVPGTGTVRWLIDDDFGVQSKIILQNKLYVPTSPICLLSPQHWAQCFNGHFPTSEGKWFVTYSNNFFLHWSQQSRVRTIPISPKTDTPIFYSSGGATYARCLTASMEHISRAPKIEHTIVFRSWQTTKEPSKELSPAPTLIPTNDDINQLTPSISPTLAPPSPYLQPNKIARHDLHPQPEILTLTLTRLNLAHRPNRDIPIVKLMMHPPPILIPTGVIVTTTFPQTKNTNPRQMLYKMAATQNLYASTISTILMHPLGSWTIWFSLLLVMHIYAPPPTPAPNIRATTTHTTPTPTIVDQSDHQDNDWYDDRDDNHHYNPDDSLVDYHYG